MGNRLYRLLFGTLLLIALYFGLHQLIYFLVSLTVFEAVTNLRIPLLIARLRGVDNPDPDEGSLGINFHTRSSFEAERGWRLLVATMLAVSVFIFPGPLWFLPWFMGFAILGAGVSGVCPMFLALKWAGLR
ncbi:DUF2892 family protein [Thiogranum longum]|uniref:DUF2892 family protein n=1 Tax=Thiogranum longum TaxID=1537524 RepID=A0A4R1HC69_9GAMM|nr:DUF2892 domain-containing protein [Thiogranum longum]TCK16809.1 DUF2892 family protein [Thiogranum longum]